MNQMNSIKEVQGVLGFPWLGWRGINPRGVARRGGGMGEAPPLSDSGGGGSPQDFEEKTYGGWLKGHYNSLKRIMTIFFSCPIFGLKKPDL